MIIGTVFGALLAWRMVGADGPTVVINELMWMGSSASSADEWIELRNLTDQPVDLSNWQLTKKSSGNEVAMLTIPTGKTLPANGYFLISNYANTNTSSVLSVVPNYVTTDVALSNSALQVKLYDQNHVLLDTADDGVGNPLAGNFDSTKKIYAAMERNPIPGDGTLGQSWHAASRGVGFQDGKTERGTPGSINSNGLPLANAGPDQNAVAGQDV
ncbi:MAG: lamin tail domain-containing protein, partial [Candidatus Kerfeldbacteria bacterium]|nr:lamin tail domain-containing protein [Candidatus Kerfeldbacteria bacterium]